MEVKYYRQQGTKCSAFTGSDEERDVIYERPEVVVFFIPIVNHLIPTEDEWEKTKVFYSSILQRLLEPGKMEVDGANEEAEVENVTDVTTEEHDESLRSDMDPTHYSKLDVNALKVRL